MNNSHINRKLGICVIVATVFMLCTAVVTAAISVSAYPTGPSIPTHYPNGPVHYPQGPVRDVPMATSGDNTVCMAWPNNDTGHWNVFFAKSTDGGKTLKTMMISTPNKGHTINQDTQISASGSKVYVTWCTNKTGILMLVFRASNDNGDTFARAITLNSTG
jgi:hypothetical protein